MKVVLADTFKSTPIGLEVEELLAPCVQCGQCTFTCPTFRLLDDEWDGPRGRIYLIKHLFEGTEPDASFLPPAYSLASLQGRTFAENVQLHLDRCLTCRSCEASCPYGVRYGRLLDLGREVVESRTRRPMRERLLRRAIRLVIPYRRRFEGLLRLGRTLRPVLPATLRQRIPPPRQTNPWPAEPRSRKMIIWQGCVQPGLAPDVNAAAAAVLDRFGIQSIPGPGSCCGAMSQHMAAPEEARDHMRRSIDLIWPYVLDGAEAIVLTASGCGAHMREYGRLLHDDAEYGLKASRVSGIVRDIAEVAAAELADRAIGPIAMKPARRIAFQSSCSLQHSQKINGVVEKILKSVGYKIVPVSYPFMCCGSAGSYSLLQPEISKSLRKLKLGALMACRPEAIATANIGCLVHLSETSPVPVHHWIELLSAALQQQRPEADAARVSGASPPANSGHVPRPAKPDAAVR